jgi:hypothetical protein
VKHGRLSVYNATHCLRPGCESWSYEPIAHGFIIILWDGVETAYCSTDCLLLDIGARTQPTISIPMEDA